MLSQFWSCGIPLIILLCWLSVNDAVPFGSHPEVESHSSESTRKTTDIVEHPREATGTKKSTINPLTKLPKIKRKNLNINQNINVNKIHTGPHTLDENVLKPVKKQRIKNDRKNSNAAVSDSNEKSNGIDKSAAGTAHTDFQLEEIPREEKESTEKCVNEVRKKDQIYTRSFPLNISSIDLDEEFKIAGEAEAKKTSSVHVGEDIALCWIETTTIKEDPAFDPPKRLVLREFTISFENSASIPDKYLECDRVEGEIATGDEETVRKTSLHEVIDENTRRSRVVNFTSVTHVGSVVVTQHKKVRCGVGAVVSKDIYEWPDGTDNPKKRVEIKVGPSIRDLNSKNDEKSGECVTSNVPKSSEVDKTGSSATDCGPGESCEISTPCKESEDCDEQSKPSSCEGDDCLVKNSSKESVTTTEPPDSDDVLAAGVTRRAATKEPKGILASEESSTPLPNESVRGNNDSCSEDDIDCSSRRSKVPSDIKDEISETSSEAPEKNAMGNSGEPCEKGSANCFCTGSSCSIHRSDEPKHPETGNKQDVNTSRCDSSESGECVTKRPGKNVFSDEEPRKKDENLLPMNSAETPVIAKETSKPPRGYLNGDDASLSCDESTDDANCKSTDPSSDTDPTSEPINDMDLSTSSEFDEEPISSSLVYDDDEDTNGNVNININDNTNTNSFDDAVPSIPPRKGNKKTSKIGTSSEFPGSTENSTPSDSESTECSLDSDSSDCKQETIPSSSVEGGTTLPSNQRDGSLSEESCESSGSCESTVDTSESTEPNEATPSLTNNTKKPGESTVETSDSTETNETAPSLTNNTKKPGESTVETSDSTETNDTVPSLTNDTRKPGESTRENSDSTDTNEMAPTLTNNTKKPGESTREDLGSTETNETAPIFINNTKKPGESTVEISDSTETNEMAPALTNNTIKPGGSTCEDGSSDSDCISKNRSEASKPCDPTSGPCSEESNKPIAESVESITTTTEATSKELETPSSTSMANVSTTAETRRNTPHTLSLTPSPDKSRHRLALRVKVLLEHINENKEKEKLVQVEKHLMLNENPNEQGNHTLLWKIKSLNNTMNMETLKAIFNCSDFEKLSDSVTNLTESNQDKTKRISLNKTAVDPALEESVQEAEARWNEGSSRKKRDANTTEVTTAQKNITMSQNVTEESIGTDRNITEKNSVTNKNITEQDFAKSANLTKNHSVKNENTTEHNIGKGKNTVKVDGVQNKNIAKDIVAKTKNITEAKATAIRESLPGVEEDIKKGLDHVFSQISKELDAPAKIGVKKAAESSSSILKILASPADGRIHLRRRRRTENLGEVMAVDALKNPVKGEEIDRWSTERLVAAADGSKVRAVTEFKLLRDAVEDSQRNPIGT